MKETIALEELKTYYPIKNGIFSHTSEYVKAVDGVSFSIKPQETLGLVGESGCGKSSLARSIVGLERLSGGKIIFKGEDISSYDANKMRPLRRSMQMVFQDPYSSLNPQKNVENTLKEIIRFHKIVPKNETDIEIDRILSLIGLQSETRKRFPHELSGGQRQRLSIAKAISVRPDFLICDEAVSALDVSIQAQILSLFNDLKTKLNLSMLFISHGLGAVSYISDRIAVMYLGKIVEIADTQSLLSNPLHPYTQALLGSALNPNFSRPRV